MSGRPSAIGFGFQYFGEFPFGSADWAEEVSWKILPAFYKEDDAKAAFTPSEPLRKLIDSYKPQLQHIIDRFERIPDLWDANKVPLPQLENLAYNFDIPITAVKSTQETVYTVGSTSSTLALSTLSVSLPASIEPGTFKLLATTTKYGNAVARDDGNGNINAGVLLTNGGSINYETGAMVGTTTTLAANSTVAISYTYTIKDENLLRSEVLNAIQFFINKGLDKGYDIAGAFSGFLVSTTPLWADGCDSNPNLSTTGPTTFFPRFDSFSADDVATDETFTDIYARWPKTLSWTVPCRSSKLNLYFFSLDGSEIEPDDFSVLVEDIIRNVERVRPIHVEINNYRFDGPGSTGGGWTIPVTTSGSIGGGWTIPVVGSLITTGGGWTIPVVATTTP